MPSTYSSNLKIELMATGENAGTWGTTTNTNLGTALEQAVVGKADVTVGSTSVTLSLTNSNAAQDARAIYLNLTGTPGGAATLEVPAVQKPYLVKNATTGGFAVTVKVSGQTGVVVPNGSTVWVYNNGTDVVTAIDHIPSLTLASALPVSSGGTGVTTATGTGSVVLSNSPTLVTPALGTPASATLTNATGLPVSTGISGLGSNVATFLATPSSSNLAAAVTDETGSGALVFGTSPTLGSPTISTPAISGGTINNTVIGGTTRAAGSFTTLDANGNTTLGDANTDTVTFNARAASNLVPSTTNTRDLGATSLVWANVYATAFTEATFPVVSQTDVGTAPNQIPLNQYLGSLAFQNAESVIVDALSASTSVTTPSVTNAGTLALSATGANVATISTNGSERVRVTSGGDVGINTTSPNYSGYSAPVLSIKNGASASSVIEIVGDTTSANGAIGILDFYNVAGSARLARIIGERSSANNSGALSFHTNNAGSLDERARIPAAGGFQCVNSISVGNATPTTSGAGITFPATQSASTDANTLDDYEEGTFTPTLAGGFSVAPTSYTAQSGLYVKIGKVVYFRINIDPNGATADASDWEFDGLPFTSQSGVEVPGGAHMIFQISANTNAADVYTVSSNSTKVQMIKDNGFGRKGNDAGVNINNRITLQGFYFTS